ncbi:MAG: DUF2849 domain-containing protein [Pikeienuella sp.]
MAKRFIPTVLTASDLMDGDAIWWTGAGWSRAIEEAEIAATPEEAEALSAIAARPETGLATVGAYLVEVETAPHPRPISRRESIRADRRPTFAFGETPAPVGVAA